MFLLLGTSVLFVKYGMVYIANFEYVEQSTVKIFLVNGTSMNFLQDIIFQTLPENLKNWFNAHAFGGGGLAFDVV